MKDEWLIKYNAEEYGRYQQRKAAVYIMLFAGLHLAVNWLLR